MSKLMPSCSHCSRKRGVVALDDRGGLDALLLGLHRDRRAVGVGAADHQHVVAGHAVVAGEDVGRQVGAGDVAEVRQAVGVRPGHGDEDAAGGRWGRSGSVLMGSDGSAAACAGRSSTPRPSPAGSWLVGRGGAARHPHTHRTRRAFTPPAHRCPGGDGPGRRRRRSHASLCCCPRGVGGDRCRGRR